MSDSSLWAKHRTSLQHLQLSTWKRSTSMWKVLAMSLELCLVSCQRLRCIATQNVALQRKDYNYCWGRKHFQFALELTLGCRTLVELLAILSSLLLSITCLQTASGNPICRGPEGWGSLRADLWQVWPCSACRAHCSTWTKMYRSAFVARRCCSCSKSHV